MKKTVHIHIGTHKTGTTAIQSFSSENISNLEKLNVYYPFISRPVKDTIKNTFAPGHHLIPWYIRGVKYSKDMLGNFKNEPEKLIPSLLEDIKSVKCENILLSSEEFDQLNEEEIVNLKEFFLDFDVKIIVYLRRKDAYIESMYQTMVVNLKFSKKINEMFETIKLPQNYFEFITKWQNVFGLEKVQINFYCKKVLKSNDIVIDFYDRLGVNIEHLIKKDEIKQVNSSIPFQYVGVITMLRRINAPDDIINSLKRIAYKIGDNASKEYHFLSLEERIKLANSGLNEIRELNLSLPDEECFSLSEEEKKKNVKQENFSALKQVFSDFEKFINKSNIQ